MTISRFAGAFAAIAIGLFGAASVPSATTRDSPSSALHLAAAVGTAMAGIDGERMRAHVQFLSDDLLEGRGPGVRGGDLAARYMAAQFELLGLQPAGAHGTYFQPVNFKGVKTLPVTTRACSPPTARHGR